MAFLETIMSKLSPKVVLKRARETNTYTAFYDYWRDQLFERIMRLFVWENTETNNKLSVKPKEIEQRLLLSGHCGITKDKNGKLLAMFGSFHGVTEYQDEYTNYNVRCPLFSSNRTINKDIVIIDNNSLRNSTYDLVHHYAVLLAHIDVTISLAMVNARIGNGTPVATTEKQKQSLDIYYGRLYNGQFGSVTDIGNLGLEYVGTNTGTSQNILDLVDTKKQILKDFYSDIGVKSAFTKRSNTVNSEVEADNSLLLLNLSDMIASRKKGAELVNKMFGTNWSVHIADEISYTEENVSRETMKGEENV